MFPVDCRNCGHTHFFFSPPPARVKCESCGNQFRTDKGDARAASSGGSPPSDEVPNAVAGYLLDRVNELTGLWCPNCGAASHRGKFRCGRCDNLLPTPLRMKTLAALGALGGALALCLYWGIRPQDSPVAPNAGMGGRLVLGGLLGSFGGALVGCGFDNVIGAAFAKRVHDAGSWFWSVVLLFVALQIAGLTWLTFYCFSAPL